MPTDTGVGSQGSFPLRGTMWEISRAIRDLPQLAYAGLEQRVARLEAELELRDLQVQYIHALDSSDVDQIMTFFAEDAVLLNPAGRSWVGRKLGRWHTTMRSLWQRTPRSRPRPAPPPSG